MTMQGLSTPQRVVLVLLRTLIGWHFLYEGFYKLMLPGWSPGGQPLSVWSAAGYLRATGGPLAGLFHRLAEPPLIAWIDLLVPVGLMLVGLSLMLGLFTQLGCWGAIALLAMFYVSVVPLNGMPQAGNEGTYLLVNKNLIELAAVVVVLAFHTGRIAGLDVLLPGRRSRGSEDRGTRGSEDRGTRGTRGPEAAEHAEHADLEDRGIRATRRSEDRGTRGTRGSEDRGLRGTRGPEDRGLRGTRGLEVAPGSDDEVGEGTKGAAR